MGRHSTSSSRVQPERGRPSTSSSRAQTDRNRSPTPEPLYYAENTDEDPEEREADENWDASDGGGATDFSDVDTNFPILGRRQWQVSGGASGHPFEQFHDTSGFEEADSTFFATSEVCFIFN
jgi:hypothetical protein